ncbi:MAG: HU family DNA-binding protein [Verrucomicrobiota bacterium JB022]|nr:HU family DNA-binding protein [Verrucomicrobiota bacterium JB022]
MKKAELVEAVRQQLGEETSKASAERAVDAVIAGIKQGLQEDQNVTLVGFGTFSVVERAARTGMNPQTKEKIEIAASKAVKFKPGSGLKDVL